MLYKFKLSFNTVDATKNICFAKSEGAVDHNIITRCFQKFCWVCKNLRDQIWSGRPKTVDSEVIPWNYYCTTYLSVQFCVFEARITWDRQHYIQTCTQKLVDQSIYLDYNNLFTESNVNIHIGKAWTTIDNCELNYNDQKIRRTSTHDIRIHWTVVLILLGLISSVYCYLNHWRSNQRPQIAEPKLYNWPSVHIAHKWR